ncbi:AAA family ATPase [Gordonia sp. OPL2]|uniref:AAA family ATPase n=1 Tax=Gordonia sp. OPL2 TaxID=2486274 RepID=UPI001655023F|nr:AAA family ATPase [Gordonia sp. OPL2]
MPQQMGTIAGVSMRKPIRQNGFERMGMYFDMRSVLEGAEPVRPDILTFGEDGALFYRGKVNSIFGDPESGKTWVALAAVADELRRGDRAMYIDIDHNGAQSIGENLLKLGVDMDTLCDAGRFRVATPFDEIEVEALVADLVAWGPDLVVLDSMGELLPIFGASSNDADDFTAVNRRVLTPLASCGAGVVVVDHLAKGADSRAHGPGGTMAKRRSPGGAMLRITVSQPFAPGRGGKAHLNVFKDRHGGVRGQVAHDKSREPLIGEFVLTQETDGGLSWSVQSRENVTVMPSRDTAADRQRKREERVEQLLSAEHKPASIREAMRFLKCGQDAARDALDEAKSRLAEAAA